MRPVLYDTSLYIEALRKGDSHFLSTRSIAPGSLLWLSSVVLEELYAGASQNEGRSIQRCSNASLVPQVTPSFPLLRARLFFSCSKVGLTMAAARTFSSLA